MQHTRIAALAITAAVALLTGCSASSPSLGRMTPLLPDEAHRMSCAQLRGALRDTSAFCALAQHRGSYNRGRVLASRLLFWRSLRGNAAHEFGSAQKSAIVRAMDIEEELSVRQCPRDTGFQSSCPPVCPGRNVLTRAFTRGVRCIAFSRTEHDRLGLDRQGRKVKLE